METQQDLSKKIIIEERASSVLYRFLISREINGKILLPANICSIVPLVFKAAKVQFEFIDINLKDYCINYEEVLGKVLNYPQKYAGVLFNHSYGYEPSPNSFFNRLKQLNEKFILIDDKCLCRPSLSATLNVDLTLYSTGYAKYIDLDKGGIGIFKDDIYLNTFSKVKLDYNLELRSSNTKIIKEKYLFQIEEKTKEMDTHKSRINSIYEYHLKNVKTIGEPWNKWRYNILIENESEQVLKDIFKAGYFASKHYVPAYKLLYPNATHIYENIINLFNDKYMTVAQAESLSNYLKERLNQ